MQIVSCLELIDRVNDVRFSSLNILRTSFPNSTYRLSHFLCRIVDVAASSVPVSLHWFRIKALKMVKNNFRKNKTIENLPHSWQRLRSLRQLDRANIEPSKADRPFRCPRKDRLEIPTVLASPLRSFQRSGCRRRGKLGSAPQRHLCRKCYLFQLHNSKVLKIYNCRSRKWALTLWSWISSFWPSEGMTVEVKHRPFYGLLKLSPWNITFTLFHAKPRLLFFDSFHGFWARMSVIGICWSAVIVQNRRQDEDVRGSSERVRENANRPKEKLIISTIQTILTLISNQSCDLLLGQWMNRQSSTQGALRSSLEPNQESGSSIANARQCRRSKRTLLGISPRSPVSGTYSKPNSTVYLCNK